MTELRIQVPEKLLPIFEPKRFKSMRGGRGSGKSHTAATALLVRGMVRPERYMCAREIQKSIKDSVHKLIADQIVRYGLGDFYDVQATTIKGINGTEFLFPGLQDHTASSIKSYEGVDVAWVEEAQTVSERSWEILLPTIRKAGSEIWATWNPDMEEDWIWKNTVSEPMPPDQLWSVLVNWRDNPWFPEVLEPERDRMKALSPDLYRHVWEGECRSMAGVMFKRDWFQRYTGKGPEGVAIFGASDYAVTEDGGDWTVHGVFGITPKGDVYVLDWWRQQCHTGTGVDAFLTLAQKWKPRTWFGEKGVIERAIDPGITKRMRERSTFVHREWLPSAGSKAERAAGFAARAEYGTVYIPSDKPWGEPLIHELCAFTGGERPGEVDDQVDVCGLVGRAMDVMVAKEAREETRKQGVKPFTWAWITANDREKPRTRID